MSEQGYEQLTLSVGGSPANRSPWLETKKVKGMIVTSGLKCSELSESLRRVGYSVRMYLESCVSQRTTYVPTWRVKTTKSGYLIMKLRLSARRTEGNESSLWRTPQTCNATQGPKSAVHMWPTPTGRDHKDGSAEACKNVPVNALLGRAVHMWPTLRANKPEGCSSNNFNSTLAMAAKGEDKPQHGQLNSEWVELLMGFPPGWSALE